MAPPRDKLRRGIEDHLLECKSLGAEPGQQSYVGKIVEEYDELQPGKPKEELEPIISALNALYEAIKEFRSGDLREPVEVLGNKNNYGWDEKTTRGVFLCYLGKVPGFEGVEEGDPRVKALLGLPPAEDKAQAPTAPALAGGPAAAAKLASVFDGSRASSARLREPLLAPAKAGAAQEQPAETGGESGTREAEGKASAPPSLPTPDAGPVLKSAGTVELAARVAWNALFPRDDDPVLESHVLAREWLAGRARAYGLLEEYYRRLGSRFPGLAGEEARLAQEALKVAGEDLGDPGLGLEAAAVLEAGDKLKEKAPRLASRLEAIDAALGEADRAEAALLAAVEDSPEVWSRMAGFQKERGAKNLALLNLLRGLESGELSEEEFRRAWAEKSGGKAPELPANWDLGKSWELWLEALEAANGEPLERLKALMRADLGEEAPADPSFADVLAWAEAQPADAGEARAWLGIVQDSMGSPEIMAPLRSIVSAMDQADAEGVYLNRRYFLKLSRASPDTRKALLAGLEFAARAEMMEKMAGVLDDARAATYRRRAQTIRSFLGIAEAEKLPAEAYPVFMAAASAAGYEALDAERFLAGGPSIWKQGGLAGALHYHLLFRRASLKDLWRRREEESLEEERSALRSNGLASELERLEASRRKVAEALNSTFFEWQSLAPELGESLMAESRGQRLYAGHNASHMREILALRQRMDAREFGLGPGVAELRRAWVAGAEGVETRLAGDDGSQISQFRSWDGTVAAAIPLDAQGQPLKDSAMVLEGIEDPSLSKGLVGSLKEGGRITMGGRSFVRQGDLLKGALELGQGESRAVFEGTVSFDDKTRALSPVQGVLAPQGPGEGVLQGYEGGRLAWIEGTGGRRYVAQEIEVKHPKKGALRVTVFYQEAKERRVYQPLHLDLEGKPAGPESQAYYVYEISSIYAGYAEPPDFLVYKGKIPAEVLANYPGSGEDRQSGFEVERLDVELLSGRSRKFSGKVYLKEKGRLRLVRTYSEGDLIESHDLETNETLYFAQEGGAYPNQARVYRRRELIVSQKLAEAVYRKALVAFGVAPEKHPRLPEFLSGEIHYFLSYGLCLAWAPEAGQAQEPCLSRLTLEAVLFDRKAGELAKLALDLELRLQGAGHGTRVSQGAGGWEITKALAREAFSPETVGLVGMEPPDTVKALGGEDKVKAKLQPALQAWWELRRQNPNDPPALLKGMMGIARGLINAFASLVSGLLEWAYGAVVVVVGTPVAGAIGLIKDGDFASGRLAFSAGVDMIYNNPLMRSAHDVLYGKEHMEHARRERNRGQGLYINAAGVLAAEDDHYARRRLDLLKVAKSRVMGGEGDYIFAEEEADVAASLGFMAIVEQNFELAKREESPGLTLVYDVAGGAAGGSKLALEMTAFGAGLGPVRQGLARLSARSAAMQGPWRPLAMGASQTLKRGVEASELAFMGAPFATHTMKELMENPRDDPWHVLLARTVGTVLGMAAPRAAAGIPRLRAQGRAMATQTSVPRFLMRETAQAAAITALGGTFSWGLNTMGLPEDLAGFVGVGGVGALSARPGAENRAGAGRGSQALPVARTQPLPAPRPAPAAEGPGPRSRRAGRRGLGDGEEIELGEKWRVYAAKRDEASQHPTPAQVEQEIRAAEDFSGLPSKAAGPQQAGRDCVVQSLHGMFELYFNNLGLKYLDFLNLLRWLAKDPAVGVNRGLTPTEVIELLERLGGGEIEAQESPATGVPDLLGVQIPTIAFLNHGRGAHAVVLNGWVRSKGLEETIYVRDSSVRGEGLVRYSPGELLVLEPTLVRVRVLNGKSFLDNLQRLWGEYQGALRQGQAPAPILSPQELRDKSWEAASSSLEPLPPTRVKQQEDGTWSVNDMEAAPLGSGGSKEVLSLPGQTALVLFSRANSAEPALQALESRRAIEGELAGRAILEPLGVVPKRVGEGRGALALEQGRRLRAVHYLMVEEVAGETLAKKGRLSAEELGLVKALFEQLAEAGVELGDTGGIARNIMIGSTRSHPARRAWVVDADKTIQRQIPPRWKFWEKDPRSALRARYAESLESLRKPAEPPSPRPPPAPEPAPTPKAPDPRLEAVRGKGLEEAGSRFMDFEEIEARFGTDPLKAESELTLGGSSMGATVIRLGGSRWVRKSSNSTPVGRKKAQNEILMREIVRRFFAADFESPQAAAYEHDGRSIVLTRYLPEAKDRIDLFMKMEPRLRHKLAILYEVFGAGDLGYNQMGDGNILFRDAGKPVLIDFEMVDREPLKRIGATNIKWRFAPNDAPFLDARQTSAQPYTKAFQEWRSGLGETWRAGLDEAMERAGLSEGEKAQYREAVSSNLGNFKHNITELIKRASKPR